MTMLPRTKCKAVTTRTTTTRAPSLTYRSADGGRFYRSVMDRYASMAEREHSRRASIQRHYRRRRNTRLAADQNIRTRLSLSPSLSPSFSPANTQ
ncbi:hypothetical protein GN244_ATG15137 [Phytophthora infestans]|uniref:Uncharacterized protein n=1 Tax=Phytophthora infestans TaxID=4787 RepID=A0A833SJE4_PHYIN|nr:hypothetical protein GN244_ATG15137 [Phytophthora infestans]KAF4140072.1 hypothetical protein GN958_ATG10734 [Phytophthora infestans]